MSVIVAPDGTRGRTRSHRRYIVARAANTIDGDRKVHIIRRTDNLVTATAVRRRRPTINGTSVFIWDQVQERVISTH